VTPRSKRLYLQRYQRSGWRHTEYQSPRFCCFHSSSAQFFFRISSELVVSAVFGSGGESKPNQEHPPTVSVAANATKARLNGNSPEPADPCGIIRGQSRNRAAISAV
jgi:hypothetical protein